MKIKIIRFKSVKSTNDEAIRLIRSDKHLLGLVSTNFQINGRGTMGKKWISDKGNIFISIFFKVNLIKIKIENYLIINAKIIQKILNEYTKKIIKLKKPNDLLIDGKKICGILQEIINHKKKKITIKKPNDLLIEKRKLCGILQEVVDFKNDKYLITGFWNKHTDKPSR